MDVDDYMRLTIKGRDLVIYLDDKGAITSICGWRSRDGGRSRHLYDLWSPSRGEPRGLAKAAIGIVKGAQAPAPGVTSGSSSPP